jgi:hypothetical protein
MAKLNQIIAVAAGAKDRTTKGINALKGKLQKSDLLQGIVRTYRPKDEEGERFPAERKLVQMNGREALEEAGRLWTELFDVIATQDYANCAARADVVVEGEIVLPQVPVTHLLFVEKKLDDLRDFVNLVPTLDPASEWEYSETAGSYVTPPMETAKTKKIPRNHIKSPATDKHPAQVEIWHEDVVVGYWEKTELSGSSPRHEKLRLLSRIDAMEDAVKIAREEANGFVIEQRNTGKAVMDFIFGNTPS